MKKILLLPAALGALALLAPTAAFAQKAQGPKAKLMAKYDLNKNGVIDGDEIAAVRKDFAAEPTGDLKRFDTDKDGKFSDAEMAEMKPPGGKTTDDAKKKGGTKKEKAAAAPSEVKPAEPAPAASKEKSP
jgi:hypothetical protein